MDATDIPPVRTLSRNGMWAFQVQCPGEPVYTSPYVYPTEDTARSAGETDLLLCTGDPGTHPT